MSTTETPLVCADYRLGQLYPLKDRVACFTPKAEKVSKGGIQLPDSMQPEHRGWAVVVAVGPDVDRETVDVGCHVVFHPGMGVPCVLENEEGGKCAVDLVSADDLVGVFYGE